MAKKTRDAGTLELAQEAAILRRQLHESSLSLASLINEMIVKQKSTAFQVLLNYLNCRLDFAQREVEKLKDIRCHVKDLAAKHVLTSESLEALHNESENRKQEAIKVTNICVFLHSTNCSLAGN